MRVSALKKLFCLVLLLFITATSSFAKNETQPGNAEKGRALLEEYLKLPIEELYGKLQVEMDFLNAADGYLPALTPTGNFTDAKTLVDNFEMFSIALTGGGAVFFSPPADENYLEHRLIMFTVSVAIFEKRYSDNANFNTEYQHIIRTLRRASVLKPNEDIINSEIKEVIEPPIAIREKARTLLEEYLKLSLDELYNKLDVEIEFINTSPGVSLRHNFRDARTLASDWNALDSFWSERAGSIRDHLVYSNSSASDKLEHELIAFAVSTALFEKLYSQDGIKGSGYYNRHVTTFLWKYQILGLDEGIVGEKIEKVSKPIDKTRIRVLLDEYLKLPINKLYGKLGAELEIYQEIDGKLPGLKPDKVYFTGENLANDIHKLATVWGATADNFTAILGYEQYALKSSVRSEHDLITSIACIALLEKRYSEAGGQDYEHYHQEIEEYLRAVKVLNINKHIVGNEIIDEAPKEAKLPRLILEFDQKVKWVNEELGRQDEHHLELFIRKNSDEMLSMAKQIFECADVNYEKASVTVRGVQFPVLFISPKGDSYLNRFANSVSRFGILVGYSPASTLSFGGKAAALSNIIYITDENISSLGKGDIGSTVHELIHTFFTLLDKMGIDSLFDGDIFIDPETNSDNKQKNFIKEKHKGVYDYEQSVSELATHSEDIARVARQYNRAANELFPFKNLGSVHNQLLKALTQDLTNRLAVAFKIAGKTEDVLKAINNAWNPGLFLRVGRNNETGAFTGTLPSGLTVSFYARANQKGRYIVECSIGNIKYTTTIVASSADDLLENFYQKINAQLELAHKFKKRFLNMTEKLEKAPGVGWITTRSGEKVTLTYDTESDPKNKITKTTEELSVMAEDIRENLYMKNISSEGKRWGDYIPQFTELEKTRNADQGSLFPDYMKGLIEQDEATMIRQSDLKYYLKEFDKQYESAEAEINYMNEYIQNAKKPDEKNRYKQEKSEFISNSSKPLLNLAEQILNLKGIQYKNVKKYLVDNGAINVLEISTEGDTPLNRFAKQVSAYGIKVVYSPKALLSEASDALYCMDVIYISKRAFDMISENSDGLHELIHAFFDILWSRGVDSDFIGDINTNKVSIDKTYEEYISVDEIAARSEGLYDRMRGLYQSQSTNNFDPDIKKEATRALTLAMNIKGALSSVRDSVITNRNTGISWSLIEGNVYTVTCKTNEVDYETLVTSEDEKSITNNIAKKIKRQIDLVDQFQMKLSSLNELLYLSDARTNKDVAQKIYELLDGMKQLYMDNVTADGKTTTQHLDEHTKELKMERENEQKLQKTELATSKANPKVWTAVDVKGYVDDYQTKGTLTAGDRSELTEGGLLKAIIEYKYIGAAQYLLEILKTYSAILTPEQTKIISDLSKDYSLSLPNIVAVRRTNIKTAVDALSQYMRKKEDIKPMRSGAEGKLNSKRGLFDIRDFEFLAGENGYFYYLVEEAETTKDYADKEVKLKALELLNYALWSSNNFSLAADVEGFSLSRFTEYSGRVSLIKEDVTRYKALKGLPDDVKDNKDAIRLRDVEFKL